MGVWIVSNYHYTSSHFSHLLSSKVYLWWGSSSLTTDTDSNHEDETTKMGYSVANKQCIGNLALDSICESLPGKGKDVPEILRWSLLPIWDMRIDSQTLSSTAKEWMVRTYSYIMTFMTFAEKCSKSDNVVVYRKEVLFHTMKYQLEWQ